ncbi:MAG: SpoIIE family protein phosphatase [Lachnospiraceae bacterium]
MELAEQLLDTGFSARSTLKLINTVLLLSGMGDRPATLDLGLVNLYTGVLEMMKLGAARLSFPPDREIRREVEILESETVPAAFLNPVEPVMISRKLWDGDKIILVSDGVLDAMPGAGKQTLSGISSMGCPTPVCRRWWSRP